MIDIDVIFFDVDGTLVDSSDDIVSAVNFTLRKLRLPEKPKSQIVSYIGTGVSDLILQSLGPDNGALKEEGIKIYSERYLAHPADESRLYPNVSQTLEYFKNKSKYILTNRYKRFADKILEELGIRNYFKDILAGDDENCLKPSSCILDRFLPKLKIKKEKAMIVGDMAIDIMTAKNSGVKSCFVTYGVGKLEEAKPLNPDFMIDDMAELKTLIK